MSECWLCKGWGNGKLASAAATGRKCLCQGEEVLLGRPKGDRQDRKEHVGLSLLLPCVSPECLLFEDPNKEHLVKQKCGSEAQLQHPRAKYGKTGLERPRTANSLIADTHVAGGGPVVYVNRFQGNWISASGKEPSCQFRRQRDAGLIPGTGRSPGGGHGNPLQYSCLEKFMNKRNLVSYSP